jgi:serine/threonine protein phosphatase 1
MRTLAIGDIHGCLHALDTLLAAVRPRPDDLVVALGDYCDRGPDTCGVINRLLELRQRVPLVALRGNHEVMMTTARTGLDRRMWLACGGDTTLASYGGRFGVDADFERIPEEHWRFVEEELVDWHETEGHIFVHANLYPELPLAEQPDYMLYWERLNEPCRHFSGKVLVCGHSKQYSGLPLNFGCSICIDTGVYDRKGWLTCLEVETGRYWQANQDGELREGRLEEIEEPEEE